MMRVDLGVMHPSSFFLFILVSLEFMTVISLHHGCVIPKFCEFSHSPNSSSAFSPLSFLSFLSLFPLTPLFLSLSLSLSHQAVPDLEEFSPHPRSHNTSDLLAPVLLPPTPSLTVWQGLYLAIACSLLPAITSLFINYAIGLSNPTSSDILSLSLSLSLAFLLAFASSNSWLVNLSLSLSLSLSLLVIFWHTPQPLLWDGCPECFGLDVFVVITLQALLGWIFQGAVVMRCEERGEREREREREREITYLCFSLPCSSSW